jgi:hypothetical protein
MAAIDPEKVARVWAILTSLSTGSQGEMPNRSRERPLLARLGSALTTTFEWTLPLGARIF